MKYLYKEEYENINNMILKIKEDYQDCYKLLNREVDQILIYKCESY